MPTEKCRRCDEYNLSTKECARCKSLICPRCATKHAVECVEKILARDLAEARRRVRAGLSGMPRRLETLIFGWSWQEWDEESYPGPPWKFWMKCCPRCWKGPLTGLLDSIYELCEHCDREPEIFGGIDDVTKIEPGETATVDGVLVIALHGGGAAVSTPAREGLPIDVKLPIKIDGLIMKEAVEELTEKIEAALSMESMRIADEINRASTKRCTVCRKLNPIKTIRCECGYAETDDF